MNKIFYLVVFFLVACQCPNQSNIIQSYNPIVNESAEIQPIDAGIIDVIDQEPIKKEPIVPKHQNILLIGDSEVTYVAWQINKIQQPNETLFIDSKPGTTIGWWNYKVFYNEMSKYPNIDIVIVFLGTNNFNFTYLQPYQNILDVINARKVKCIWVGPTNVNVTVNGYKNQHIIGGLIKNAVSDTCTYVDTEKLDIQLADGVHPTAQGSIKWLTEIWKVKTLLK